jgi:hypothetical protein
VPRADAGTGTGTGTDTDTGAGAAGLLRRRLTAQGLAGRPLGRGGDGPVAVARRLLATQAQDARGFRLAVRARSAGTTGADVDRALTDDRSLVVTWLNRGTLHLVTREDYPLLQALVAPSLRVSGDTRLANNGYDADLARRAMTIVDRALADAGPLSRHALRERLRAAGLPAEGTALIHVLFRASLEGLLVRGPVGEDGEHLYARVADWLPEAPAAVAAAGAEPERGYAELVRRYLAGHAPAHPRDIATWMSVPLGRVRAGLERIAGDLRERRDATVELTPRAGGVARASALPAPRLLGAFEPALLGWRDREFVLGAQVDDVITGGIFRGFAMVHGRCAATWRFDGPRVAITPLRRLDDEVSQALERDGEAVCRFLGRPGQG